MSEDIRRFGPKTHESAEQDAIAGRRCPACHNPFQPGEYTTLIALGPGDDPESQERCQNGRTYNAVAVEVHYACATGRER